MRRRITVAMLSFLIACMTTLPSIAQEKLGKGEVKDIAEEAFIYAFSMIRNYGTMYQFAIDKSAPQYRGPLNQISSTARVLTPKDTTVVTQG